MFSTIHLSQKEIRVPLRDSLIKGYLATVAQLFFALQRLINKFPVRLKLSGKLFKIRCSMSLATKMIVAFVIVFFRPLISAILVFFDFSKTKLKIYRKIRFPIEQKK